MRCKKKILLVFLVAIFLLPRVGFSFAKCYYSGTGVMSKDYCNVDYVTFGCKHLPKSGILAHEDKDHDHLLSDEQKEKMEQDIVKKRGESNAEITQEHGTIYIRCSGGGGGHGPSCSHSTKCLVSDFSYFQSDVDLLLEQGYVWGEIKSNDTNVIDYYLSSKTTETCSIEGYKTWSSHKYNFFSNTKDVPCDTCIGLNGKYGCSGLKYCSLDGYDDVVDIDGVGAVGKGCRDNCVEMDEVKGRCCFPRCSDSNGVEICVSLSLNKLKKQTASSNGVDLTVAFNIPSLREKRMKFQDSSNGVKIIGYLFAEPLTATESKYIPSPEQKAYYGIDEYGTFADKNEKEFSSSDYDRISEEDNNYVTSEFRDYNYYEDLYAYHRFNFTISEPLFQIKNIEIKWKGYGYGNYWNHDYGHSLWVKEEGKWVKKASGEGRPDTFTVSYREGDIQKTNGTLEVAVQSDINDLHQYSSIKSDYIEVIVTYDPELEKESSEGKPVLRCTDCSTDTISQESCNALAEGLYLQYCPANGCPGRCITNIEDCSVAGCQPYWLTLYQNLQDTSQAEQGPPGAMQACCYDSNLGYGVWTDIEIIK
ncbi:MAG: hypothetical protein J7K31_04385 [Candidatus Aenigmarchaeota archaeon]|nr:hypothetical protein [Candidatus Aenigmarchaeota archaeon]